MRALFVAMCLMVTGVSCSSGTATRRPPAPTTTTQLSPGTQTTPAELGVRLRCRDVIGWVDAPTAGLSVVLDRVALPTGTSLQVAAWGESAPDARLFAKQGLLVAPEASFELLVPPAWRGRLTIGWGSHPTRTRRLVVSGCHSSEPGAHWLAFAGGFWVKDPACVPLIVRAAQREQLVHIGVGKACPGQSRPPAPV